MGHFEQKISVKKLGSEQSGVVYVQRCMMVDLLGVMEGLCRVVMRFKRKKFVQHIHRYLSFTHRLVMPQDLLNGVMMGLRSASSLVIVISICGLSYKRDRLL